MIASLPRTWALDDNGSKTEDIFSETEKTKINATIPSNWKLKCHEDTVWCGDFFEKLIVAKETDRIIEDQAPPYLTELQYTKIIVKCTRLSVDTPEKRANQPERCLQRETMYLRLFGREMPTIVDEPSFPEVPILSNWKSLCPQNWVWCDAFLDSILAVHQEVRLFAGKEAPVPTWANLRYFDGACKAFGRYAPLDVEGKAAVACAQRKTLYWQLGMVRPEERPDYYSDRPDSPHFPGSTPELSLKDCLRSDDRTRCDLFLDGVLVSNQTESLFEGKQPPELSPEMLQEISADCEKKNAPYGVGIYLFFQCMQINVLYTQLFGN